MAFYLDPAAGYGDDGKIPAQIDLLGSHSSPRQRLSGPIMKEDILEQLVDDYLQLQGYFTRHNVKFRPRNDHPEFVKDQDSNHSDIDVIGYNPLLAGTARVWVVSCKSWQSGFSPNSKISELESNKVRGGRESWKAFRELMVPKWTEAFIAVIKQETGETKFTFVTTVTILHGDRSPWEDHERFRRALRGNPLKLLSINEILAEVVPRLNTTVAPSSLARTLQLLKASKYLRPV